MVPWGPPEKRDPVSADTGHVRGDSGESIVIHALVYRRLTEVVVEWTCCHREGAAVGSHLLYREVIQAGKDDGPWALLGHIADASCSLARLGWEDELPGLTDDCGWT